MIDNPNADDLLAEIERFLAGARMSATEFGKSAVNDGHLVHDLRSGRTPTEQLAQRIRVYIADERAKIVGLLQPAPRSAAA